MMPSVQEMRTPRKRGGFHLEPHQNGHSASPSPLSSRTSPFTGYGGNGSLSKSSDNSRSFLNLTTSALSGVFGSQVSLAELNGDVKNSTLNGWTPPRPRRNSEAYPETRFDEQHSKHPSKPPGTVILTAWSLGSRIITLFVFGIAYGQIARQLHDNDRVTDETLNTETFGLLSLLFWGSQGVVMGFFLPFLDHKYPQRSPLIHGRAGADWGSIIRAIAAFMGVSYGVRKLPWNSSLQAAAIWSFLNPCLWYILDTTRNGFILSSITGISWAVIFAGIFPSHLPVPSFSQDYISVAFWVASVFFCQSICFGNLGRRLLTFDQHINSD